MTAASGSPRLTSMARVLERQEVEYILIGGMAAVLQGSPYVTYDVDICPEGSKGNLERLSLALQELDAQEWDVRKDEAKSIDWTAEVLAADSTWLLLTKFGRLDLVFVPAGTSGHGDLRRRLRRIEVAGLPLPVSHIEDIIRMRETAARERDLVQLPTLRKLLDRLEG